MKLLAITDVQYLRRLAREINSLQFKSAPFYRCPGSQYDISFLRLSFEFYFALSASGYTMGRSCQHQTALYSWVALAMAFRALLIGPPQFMRSVFDAFNLGMVNSIHSSILVHASKRSSWQLHARTMNAALASALSVWQTIAKSVGCPSASA